MPPKNLSEQRRTQQRSDKVTSLVLGFITSTSFADFTHRCCELEGVRTANGESVRCEWYMKPDFAKF